MRRKLSKKLMALTLILTMLMPFLPQSVQKAYAENGSYTLYYKFEKYEYWNFRAILATSISSMPYVDTLYKKVSFENGALVGYEPIVISSTSSAGAIIKSSTCPLYMVTNTSVFEVTGVHTEQRENKREQLVTYWYFDGKNHCLDVSGNSVVTETLIKKVEDVIALKGTYPDRGVYNGYYYINVGAGSIAPTLTLTQAENTTYSKTASMPISGTFKDADTTQNVGVRYSIETPTGTVIRTGVAAADRVSNDADQNLQYDVLLGSDVSVGTYKLKVWAQDNIGYKSPLKVLTVEKIAPNNIKVVKDAVTNSQLNYTVTADTTPFTLSATPYSVEVKQSSTSVFKQEWVAPNSGNTYKVNLSSLLPNTPYTIIAKGKNSRDLISEVSQTNYTLATTPQLKAEMTNDKKINIDIEDNNPSNTEYRITVTDGMGIEKNVDSLGKLVALSPTTNWQTLATKKITVIDSSLDPSKSYTVKAVARNSEGTLTGISTPVQTMVTTYSPIKVSSATISTTESSASVKWQPIKDAIGYKLKLYSGGTLVKEVNTDGTTVTFDSLQPNSKYTVEIVVSYTLGDSGAFKEYFTTKGLDGIAPVIAKETAEIDNYNILLKWAGVPDAVGYQVEADGEVYSVGKELSFKHMNLPPNSRHVYRVRTLNSKGYGPWSERVSLKTTKSPLPDLLNDGKYTVTATDQSIILTWDIVPNASRYEIRYNGGHIIDNGESNFCIRGSLKPDTQYDFTIAAIDDYDNSRVIAMGSAKTMLLKAPVIDKVVETSEGFLVSWKPITGATSYKVMVDGVDTGITINEPKYEVKGLGAKEVKNYSFAAFSEKGISAWSKAISIEGISKIPQVPVNLNSAASSKTVVLTWDAAESDEDILYEVEVDGVVVEPNDKNKYIDDQVEPFSTHTYRVRSKNLYAFSPWSDPLTITTLPGVPEAPKNIAIENSTYFATLSWQNNDSIDAYEVALQNPDGSFNVVNIGNRNFYRQRGVLNVEQAYKIRGINLIGTGQWSNLIVNNAIKALCEKNKEIDLGLTASNIVDFEKYELQVTYNPGAIEVTDLCGYTTEKELKPGKIEGTDIEVISFEPGKIVFRVKKGIAFGNMWSGVVNNIKFTSKVNGGSYISYTVFIDEGTKNTSGTAKKEELEE